VGLIKNILFKSDSLGISLKMVDNSTKQFRLIPGMTSSGFMISPLIENAQEFSYLYSQNQLLDKNKVSSFSVIPGNGNTMDWDNEYIVVFSGSLYGTGQVLPRGRSDERLQQLRATAPKDSEFSSGFIFTEG
jgi:hypothetical protein